MFVKLIVAIGWERQTDSCAPKVN